VKFERFSPLQPFRRQRFLQIIGEKQRKSLTKKNSFRYYSQERKIMENTISTFSKTKLGKAVHIKWPGCLSGRRHVRLADALTEHLGRPISATQAKGWLDGIKPGSDMLIAIAQVLDQELGYFYE
jgi:hypothetical protein